MYFKKNIKKQKGFTLLELLTVIAIFGILTAIVVGNYGKFTNDTTLTNMAYEVALSIREAQIYGVAVSNRQDILDFDNQFGINFYKPSSSDNVQTYHLFEDLNDSNLYESAGNCPTAPSQDACYQEYILQRNIKIDGLYVDKGPVEKLDIVFDRPNPEPIINGVRNKSAQIKLVSPEGSERYIHVSSNGQIYVSNSLDD